MAGLLLTGMLTGCGATEEKTQSAMELIGSMQYQEALALLDEAAEEGENLRLVDRARGIAYMGITEYEQAIEAFKASLAGSNGIVENIDCDLNSYLAAAYTKNGQYQEAKEVYDAILALKENQADAYFLRGNARMWLSDYDGAKADFERALALEPKNYDRLIELYQVLEHFGHREEGQAYLEAALASGDKMDNYVVGRIYYYLGEYQKAYLALEEAKEKGGAESYLYLGRAYEATGDYNYAANVYNSWLAKNEGNAEMYNQLGLCEMNRGEYQKALEAFQAGKELEGGSMMQSLSFNEVVAYEHLGDFEQAKALLGTYLANYPDDGNARREYEFLSTR